MKRKRRKNFEQKSSRNGAGKNEKPKEERRIILDEKALKRCGSGIRRLLLIENEEEIIRLKEEDDKRIAMQLKNIQKEQAKTFTKQEVRFGRTRSVFPHPVFGAIIFDKLRKKPLKIRAIVNFSGNPDDLKTMGISVHTHVQNIFTITATKAQLAGLATQAATQKINLPRMFFPTLADSVPAAEIDQIHAVGTRGNGTIVGIVDGMLHVAHHAFRDPNAPHNTRVRFLWVQDPNTGAGGAMPPGQTPEDYFNDNVNHPNSPDFTGLDYGRIYDVVAINTAIGLAAPYGTGANQIAAEPDPVESEHGTHVAGIAAGSGHQNNWATAPVNIGAAPLADIVHVHYRFSGENVQDGVWEDDIINALNFILRVADNEGRPVVINNSYGTNIGPHNGNADFDALRNAMLDSHFGRSLVFTAGNDNNDQGFRKGTIADSGGIEIINMNRNNNWWDIWLEVWYSGPDLDFQIDSGAGYTGWQVPANDFNGLINGHQIEVTRDVDPISGMKNIRLYVPAAIADWTIRLRNNGAGDAQYWAWTGGQGSWADVDNFTIDEMTVGDTGCAQSLLTVGSCDKPAGGAVELISDYSGCGPTLDGRIKPEITAVGRNIQSADSRTTGGYTGKSGTSMAAPLTAGAIALLLENDPNLNQDAIKALLIQTADRTGLNIDPDAAGYDPVERNAYGYGRLRMLASFQHSMPLVDVDVWVRTAGDDYGFEPYPGECFCHAPEVKVFDSAGNEVTTLQWEQEHTVRVRIHNLGDTAAINTTVRLKYTRPWAAPDDWVACQDAANNAIEQIINVPPLGYYDLTFIQLWKPQESELPAGGADWGDHYCLLVELDHTDDSLQYDDSTVSGRDPWIKNIKGTNNVALRNLHIH